MRSVLVISLIAIFCVVFLSARKLGDNIANFKGCIQACRAQNNTFRFCTGFCTPSKPHQVAKKHAEEGKKILKEILGDNYENEADSEQNLNTDSRGLWEKYRTVLKDFFRQGNANALPGLQLVPNPLPADWDIQPEILTNFCNRIPKWGSVYEPSSNEVTAQYGDWIYNINAPQVRSIAPDTFSGVDDRLRSAERAINNAELDCMDAFDMRYGNRRSLAGPPPTYETYMGRFCPRIDRANKEYDMALADYEIQQRQVYGEHFALARSIAKFSTASRMNKFPWVTLGSMQRFVESAKENRTNAFEIKITSKTTVTTEKTFSMNIGVGFSYADFASITANYQTSKLDFKTSTDELQLIVGAAGYKVFPVYPDRSWFSPELFQKYKNSPLRNPKNYFGKDGALPMMPKTFIVVVGPRLTMLVSHEDASKVEKSSQFGVKLTVAGFSFDFAKSASLKKSQESANLFKITIEGNSYEPQVLAVDNELFADV